MNRRERENTVCKEEATNEEKDRCGGQVVFCLRNANAHALYSVTFT